MLMLLTGFAGLWLMKTKQLDTNKSYLRLCVLMGPAGFVAVISGWFTAEVGRQPYTVYGLLKTIESTSPVTAGGVGMSLLVFVFTYVVVFSAGLYYILKLIRKGPQYTAHPDLDLESEPVLGTRLDIGDYEHQLKISTQHATEGKPG
jgi:cytochrome d ubiquinol oxidase subunit I